MSTKTDNIKGLMANPKTRLVIIVTGFILLGSFLAGLTLLKKKAVPPQLQAEVTLGKAPSLASTPGATENQKYVDASNDLNNKKFDAADKTGGSSLPTPVKLADNGLTIGTGTSSLGGPAKPKPDEQIPNTQAPQMPSSTLSMPPPVVVPQPTYRNGGQAVSIAIPQNAGRQLDVLLERWAPTGQTMETDFTGGNRGGVATSGSLANGSGPRVNLVQSNGQQAAVAQAGGLQQVAANSNQMINPKLANITAGTLYAAVLTTGIDTDEPGPVLAEIVEGPFAGAKVIGTVTTGGSTASKATLSFNVITTKGAPSSAQIKAYAVNQETARTGLATDVDHHYLERYGLLFAASFMNGFGTALATAGTTVTTAATGVITTASQARTLNNRQDVQELGAIALGEVGKEVGKSLAQNVNRPVTVKVAPGTPIAVLFMQDVMVPVK